MNINPPMREAWLQKPPSRIVSLVPSITLLLSDLGLDDAIAGITKFCVLPEKLYRTKIHIGGTKNPDHEKIRQLQPDLIIANKEENKREDVETLAKEFPVWITDIKTLDDATRMIEETGIITGKKNEAFAMNAAIKKQFAAIQPLQATNALYLIWEKPYMAAGNDTFIDAMMNCCGFSNVLSQVSRYPELSEATMTALHPDVVLLSSEPFPFREKHIAEISAIFPAATVLTVDGTYFSWYGSRLLKASEYFNTLLSQIRFLKKQTPLHED